MFFSSCSLRLSTLLELPDHASKLARLHQCLSRLDVQVLRILESLGPVVAGLLVAVVLDWGPDQVGLGICLAGLLDELLGTLLRHCRNVHELHELLCGCEGLHPLALCISRCSTLGTRKRDNCGVDLWFCRFSKCSDCRSGQEDSGEDELLRHLEKLLLGLEE